jgi:hypothetical protein
MECSLVGVECRVVEGERGRVEVEELSERDLWQVGRGRSVEVSCVL